MSQKRKIQRARHEAKVEEEGKNVVKWIFGALVALAVVYAAWTILVQ